MLESRLWRAITYSFLGIDHFIDSAVVGSGLHVASCQVELANQAVIAVAIVVEAFDLDAPVQVTIAQGSDGNGEPLPNRVDIVVDVLGSMNDGEGASLVGLGELKERI